MNSRNADWKGLEAFLTQCGNLSIARVPLEEFRAGSLLYRKAVADLAYARMRFPGHAVVKELERLVGRAHSAIYQARRGSSTRWWDFWRVRWPAAVRAAYREILLATALFWIAAAAGLVLTQIEPRFETFFVSSGMRDAMRDGHLWTESLTKVSPEASSAIARNNITVSLTCWALGITFGAGTLWMLLFNGLMLGVIFAACIRAGLSANLLEFVIAHGSIELPSIWLAAGAGFVMARPLIFPGRYSRSVELSRAARHSVQIVVGVIPILLVAGAVEGFVSPSDLPGWSKAFLGCLLAGSLLAYILLAPRPGTAAEAT